jgi:tRNA-specific 2-thiouridylase
MSGGVDSSVAAHLLRAAGHEVIGLFMRHGEQSPSEVACAISSGKTTAEPPKGSGVFFGSGSDPSGQGSPEIDSRPRNAASLQLPILTPRPGHKQGCCSASDADDARRVADRLDIPFYALNFAEEFGEIMDYFVEEYTSGRTPNPCVVCNNWLKFGKLCEYADSVGAEFVATGHYARLVATGTGEVPALCRGVDPGKDQSYVLFGIDREVLRRALFPVGDYRKDEIRALAKEIGLRVADKRDSQEICFVPDGDYASFVRRRHAASGQGDLDLSGEIVTVEGQVVGRHEGLEHFTIGQRKGLGLAFGEPRYVVRIERDTRRVVIGTQEQLARTDFTAGRANWLIDEPREPLECTVKIRYLSQPVPATVTLLADRRLHIRLHEPRTGIAPGQAAVCYAGDRVLGGGWIEA